jgi:folate-binding protein YgfZ
MTENRTNTDHDYDISSAELLKQELQKTPLRGFLWPNSLVIMVTNKDAERYLHNRLTQNIKSLEIMKAKPFAATTSQSKVQAIGHIIKLSDHRYLLAMPIGDRERMRNAIAEFKVADRVDFEVLPDAKVTSILCDASCASRLHASINAQASTLSNGQIHYLTVLRPWGIDLIETTAQVMSNSYITAITWDEFNSARISNKVPLFSIDFDEKTLLMDTGLRDHIAFGAGCYVGQEVIEKIDARGKAPHRFGFFSLNIPENEPDPTDQITENHNLEGYLNETWKNAGHITSYSKLVNCPDSENNTTVNFIAFIKNENFSSFRYNKFSLIEA